MTKSEKNI